MYRPMLNIALLVAALGVAACGGKSPAAPAPVTGGGNGGGSTEPPPPPPPPPPAPTLAITTILAFGDSITEGVVSSPQSTSAYQPLSIFKPPPVDAGQPGSYPAKLQASERARYTAQTITVLNAGVAGNLATDDRDRLYADVKATSPQVVLLMEGVNDLNGGLGLSAAVNAMEDMVRDTLARNVPVMLATLPPQRRGGVKAAAADLVPKYNDQLRAMAAKKGAMLVDVGAQFPVELVGQDGLHPTDAGYDLIAKIFQDAIAAKWETPATTSAVRR